MRAAVVHAYGEAPRVDELADPEPDPSAGREVVSLVAGGLNPVDISIASGSFAGASVPLPYIAGREGVGRAADGSLVYFEGAVFPAGAFAERALVDTASLIPLPDGIDPALAVCFGIAGVAAWVPLETRAGLRSGETVLVLGAGGVVGSIAVQAARVLGAGRVVAASRDAAGLERARAHGADAIVQIGAVDDLALALREACGGGADVVVDPLWGEPAAAAAAASKPNARLVQIGQSAGSHSSIASADVRHKQLAILGHANARVPPESKRSAYLRMIEHAMAGRLTVSLERVPLERVGEAWERQRGLAGAQAGDRALAWIHRGGRSGPSGPERRMTS
jgi:NADPH2:quinone reductase